MLKESGKCIFLLYSLPQYICSLKHDFNLDHSVNQNLLFDNINFDII
jgi:hypothetical protein